MLADPGVYKIAWHNEYSLFNAKTVKYKLRVIQNSEEKKRQHISARGVGQYISSIVKQYLKPRDLH